MNFSVARSALRLLANGSQIPAESASVKIQKLELIKCDLSHVMADSVIKLQDAVLLGFMQPSKGFRTFF